MTRSRTVVILLGGAAALMALAVVRHLRGGARGRAVPGGILVGDAVAYDAATGLALGPFYRRIAADVAGVAPDGARVLEVGCGPGRLSIRLARRYGLDVTGVDLDPAMIARARANAGRSTEGDGPTFVVGDAAALSFPDASFDLVVSTLSMHHWADPAAGLAEIARVLRPCGRAIVWDLRPGAVPFHRHAPDPLEAVHDGPLVLAGARPWRWPWWFSPTQRLELVRVGDPIVTDRPRSRRDHASTPSPPGPRRRSRADAGNRRTASG